jgi:very-short-patch-repair endonuclease
MKFLRNDPALKQRRKDLRRNQTEAEKTLWAHLHNRQLCSMKFFRQYSVGPYVLDFYCPAMKLALEVDGGQHNQVESQEYDAVRSEYLKEQGIDVMRFWNHELLIDITYQNRLRKELTRITPPNLP